MTWRRQPPRTACRRLRVGALHKRRRRNRSQLRRWVVKYSSGIIGAAKSHGHAGQEAARQALGGELSQLGPSDRREMPSGSVWGLDVVVDAWLVGPISRPQLSRKHSQLSV